MRIEPRKHSFQGVLDELIVGYRFDIAPLHLFEHVLEEAEIAAIPSRGGGTSSGAVATVKGHHHQERGGSPGGRTMKAGARDHRTFGG
jgi:hypothetical protein